MTSWRDHLLQSLVEPMFSLYVVFDPDKLLLDERVLHALMEKQIDVVTHDDPVQFRFLFESRYRELLTTTDVRLLVRTENGGVSRAVPYDLLQAGCVRHLRLEMFFPKMSVPVLRQLTAEERDALYAVYDAYDGSPSDRDTLDFLLRKVYKIPYDVIDTEADLLKWLLSIHGRKRKWSPVIQQFFIRQLMTIDHFRSLPVKQWVESARHFYSYLQEEWAHFLDKYTLISNGVREGAADGSLVHPFADSDVRRMLNDLFIDGTLTPVERLDAQKLPAWTHVGIVFDPASHDKQRFNRLLVKINEQFNARTRVRYDDWAQMAKMIGDLKWLAIAIRPYLGEQTVTTIEEFVLRIDHSFEQWMLKEYGSLANLPYLPLPVMVHHIPHYLASRYSGKVALIVLDGTSVVQWAQIRQVLVQNAFQLEEHHVFAWVPTVTSVSRQALFSGKMPMYFPETLMSTAQEAKAWTLFWENQRIPRQRIQFQKRLGHGEYCKDAIDALSKPQTVVAGLVVDMVDQLSHHAVQGHAGLSAQLDLWLEKGYLQQLVTDLLRAGFSVFITSDHGNKESRGIGRINDGVFVETKGERVRIYKDTERCRERAEQYGAIVWPNIGLPRDFAAMVAKSGDAFISERETTVCHGGISLEEVIVPFVHVTRKQM